MSWDEGEQARLLAAVTDEYAVLMTDPDGVVRSWNKGAEAIFGYAAAEILGESASVLFTPEDRAAGVPERELARALRDGRTPDIRWHSKKDGSRFWANGVTVPLYDPDGRHKGFSKIARDETDTKLLIEEIDEKDAALVAADRRKDLFLATLAHEVRNPLHAASMAVMMLRQAGHGDKAVFDEMLGVIDRQLRNVNGIIDDLSDVARIGAGKVELRPRKLDVAEAIERAAETVRPTAEERRHRLVVARPAEPVCVEADPQRLQQVLANLLTNACKYTPEGGEIRLAAAVEGDEVVFRVRDDGLGIPPELQPKVFDLFRQIDYSFERSGGGLGIGLSVVRSLIELHGGTVEVKSEGTGKGSEFAVRLKACG